MNGPQLRDIHLPAAPWWPPAPGWWVLAAAVLLVALGVAWWWRRAARARLPRAVLREIDALEAGYARDGDAARVVDGASRLLRRVARRVEPEVASRTGEAWRAFVHRYARAAVTRAALDQLADARFRAQPTVEIQALLVALRQWCRDALRASQAPGGVTPAQYTLRRPAP